MMKKRPMKAYSLVLRKVEFFLLGQLSKLASVVIANPNFSQWIMGKYVTFRIWHTRFPTLIMLIIRHTPFLQNLLVRNIVIISPNRNYYLSPKISFNMNLSPQLSSVTKDRVEKDRALFEGSSHKGTAGLDSLFIHPDVPSSKHRADSALGNQPVYSNDRIIEKNRLEEDKALYGNQSYTDLEKLDSLLTHHGVPLSKYILQSTPRIEPIFLKTFNMLVSAKFKRSQHSPAEVITSLLRLPYNHQNKLPFSSGGKFSTVGYKPMGENKWDVIYPDTKSDLYYKSERLSSDTDLGSQKPIIESTGDSISENVTPTLHYINPLKNALDDLKNSVAGIEKRVTESENTIKKSGYDDTFISRKLSDVVHKKDININLLTEQVYNLMERKLRIEQERRGLL